MQMHIINKNDHKKDSLTDHTLIIKKIDKSIRFYDWYFILPFLPSGSFLVGGYIRDVILGRLTNKIDIDIVVPENAIEVGKKIAENFKSKFIILDKGREVVRIIFKNISIDIASLISHSIEIDLSSRDFSINSIAFSFDKKLLIDPLNGISDIELSLLRTNSKQNLIDDPLRILRCFRFVSELDFNIDQQLMNFIKKYKNKLRLISKERINYELQRIIRGEKAIKSIQLIKKIRIFNYMQSDRDLISIDLKKINTEKFNQLEKDKFLPLFFLDQILDDVSLKKLSFGKSEILKIKLLRKWKLILNKKTIYELNEKKRFDLHKDLENILPSFIFYLPQKVHQEWLDRWRDKDDKLFHPSNLIKGDVIKKQLKLQDGPLLGKLILYLSMELAFNRLDDFDEAIYKAKQWIKQNAPKCD